MIIDTILYSGEQDMLECRLTEIGDVIDYCVVVEGSHTFTGEPRTVYPLYKQERFARWQDKIKQTMLGPLREEYDADYVLGPIGDARIVPREPPMKGPWEQERYARQIGVQHARDIAKELKVRDYDTKVLIADVDEIPRAEVLTAPLHQVMTLQLRHHCLELGWLHPQNPCPASIYAPLKFINNPGEMRLNRFYYPPIEDAGWHLSWFGNERQRVTKAHSFSHQEERWLGEPGVLAEMAETGDIWHGQRLTGTPRGLDYPKWIEAGYQPVDWGQRP